MTAFALAEVGYYRKIELFKILPNLSVLLLCFCYCFSCFCFVLFLFFSQRNWDWKIAGVNKQSWPEKQVKLLRIVFLKMSLIWSDFHTSWTGIEDNLQELHWIKYFVMIDADVMCFSFLLLYYFCHLLA